MNRIYKSSFLLLEGILFVLLFVVKINIPCFFKTFLHIPCVGCGMTRSIYAIFDFRILDAISYNILTIPLFIVVMIINGIIIYDIINNENKVIIFLNKIVNNYKVIIGACVITFIINLYNGI